MNRRSSQPQRSQMLACLRECQLFHDLPRAELARIARFTCLRTLAKDDYLFFAGAPVYGFFIVKSGAIKLYRGNWLGREQVIQICRPGDSFAEESLMSEQGYAADACATEPSEVWVVGKEGFLDLLRDHPMLVLCMLRSMSRQISHLIHLLDDLRLKDVKTRVAQWLIHHCPNPHSRQPQRIELPMAKCVLASELGTSSETFSRTLAKFRKSALLEVEGNVVTLLCPEKLAAWLRANPGKAPLPSPDPLPARRRPKFEGTSTLPGSRSP